MMPGEALLSGQISGQQLGNALFQFLPCLPHEGPPGMPRALARQLFPQGFVPGRFPALPVSQPPVAQPLIPPAGTQPPAPTAARPPAQPQPAAVAAPPNPAPMGYRPTASGGEPIQAKSQRIRIVERKGL